MGGGLNGVSFTRACVVKAEEEDNEELVDGDLMMCDMRELEICEARKESMKSEVVNH